MLWVTAKRIGEDFASTTQLAVADALKNRGCVVTFVAPKSVKNRSKKVVGKSGHACVWVTRSRQPGLGWFTFGYAVRKALPSLLEKGGFDVALVDWQAVAGSKKALSDRKIPWLLLDRSPPVFKSLIAKMQWYEYRRAYRLASRSPTIAGIVPKSQALSEWNKKSGRTAISTTILEAGVDISKFRPADFEGEPTIIYHGQIDSERKCGRLISIGEVLAARGFDFKMRIIGGGNLFEKLRKEQLLHPWLTVENALPSDEIPELLSSCHIGLFPLPDSEIWRLASPLKIREWAAAGLPMILSDITPHRSIGDRKWARLVRHNAPMDEWADACERMLSSDLKNLGAMARADAEAEFDWQKTTEELYQKLTEMVGE